MNEKKEFIFPNLEIDEITNDDIVTASGVIDKLQNYFGLDGSGGYKD